MLEAAQLSPAATGVQWFKVAAHARSEHELEQTARGISAALARDGDDSRALRTISTFKELGEPSQVRVIEQVQPRCDRWPPNVTLEAAVAPLQAAPSSVVSLAVSVTSATAYSGLVDVEIYAGDGHVLEWLDDSARVEECRGNPDRHVAITTTARVGRRPRSSGTDAYRQMVRLGIK